MDISGSRTTSTSDWQFLQAGISLINTFLGKKKSALSEMYLVPNRLWKFTRHTSLKTDLTTASIKT